MAILDSNGKPFVTDSVSQKRSDGWINAMTGLSVFGKDKRLSAEVIRTKMTRDEAENLYKEDDIASRIVDRTVEEMTREGFELKVEDDVEKEFEEAVFEEFKRLSLYSRIEEAMKWARVYGGAGLVFGHVGQSLDTPVEDGKKTPLIQYVLCLDRYRLLPFSSSLISDPASPYFGMPEFYSIVSDGLSLQSSNGMNSGQKIHHSRIVRFEGVRLPWYLQQEEQYWGDSIFLRIREPLMNYHTANSSAATIMQDFVMQVFKMEELADLIANGDEELVRQRVFMASRMGSIVNSLVIKSTESIEKMSTNVSGIADLLKAIKERLAAATDMPHTILFGESPSGLGATGDSEKRDWYDHIKNKQESELRPRLERIIKMILAQNSFSKGDVNKKFEIEFCPLWQMDEKSTVEMRKIQAETDQIYISNGVLDPAEVTKSRFGELGYSIETTVDLETRDALEAPDAPMEEQTEPEENDEETLGQGGSDAEA